MTQFILCHPPLCHPIFKQHVWLQTYFLLEMSAEENHFSETRSCFIKNHWSRSQSSVLSQTERSGREQNINNALEPRNEKAAAVPSSPQSLKSSHSTWSLSDRNMMLIGHIYTPRVSKMKLRLKLKLKLRLGSDGSLQQLNGSFLLVPPGFLQRRAPPSGGKTKLHPVHPPAHSPDTLFVTMFSLGQCEQCLFFS